MTQSNASVIDLCERIDAVFTDNDEPETVFRAMLMVMTKHMSYLCADCRENLADEIMDRVPDMLERANAAAAERSDASDHPHIHLSH
jgi:hypothetical protein